MERFSRSARIGHVERLPISAIVVGLNEAHFLTRCLDSISFCSEILYVDLGSSDKSLRIAEKFASKTISHPLVPSGEHAVANVFSLAQNDWILFIDPDESLDARLRQDVVQKFLELKDDSELGALSAPWQFYFKGRKLNGTPWGGRRPRTFLAHRARFRFTPETHRGRLLIEGFKETLVESEGEITHQWSNSWQSLLHKHIRYLRTEGGSRYRRGDRISFGGIVAAVPRIFASTFRTFDARDGALGFGLSWFFIAYKLFALGALWSHQARSRRETSFLNNSRKG